MTRGIAVVGLVAGLVLGGLGCSHGGDSDDTDPAPGGEQQLQDNAPERPMCTLDAGLWVRTETPSTPETYTRCVTAEEERKSEIHEEPWRLGGIEGMGCTLSADRCSRVCTEKGIDVTIEQVDSVDEDGRITGYVSIAFASGGGCQWDAVTELQ